MGKGRTPDKQRVHTSVRTRAIGHALIAAGGPAVMNALEDGPRQWTQIQEETGLDSVTLNRARNALVNAEIIVSRPIRSLRKGSMAYELSEFGRELQKLLTIAEKLTGTLPIETRSDGTGT